MPLERAITDKIISSMRRRINTIIRNGGGRTKY